MSDKYKAKDENGPLKNQKLSIFKGFDEYPDWAVFKGEDGLDYTLPFEKVDKVEDEDSED